MDKETEERIEYRSSLRIAKRMVEGKIDDDKILEYTEISPYDLKKLKKSEHDKDIEEETLNRILLAAECLKEGKEIEEVANKTGISQEHVKRIKKQIDEWKPKTTTLPIKASEIPPGEYTRGFAEVDLLKGVSKQDLLKELEKELEYHKDSGTSYRIRTTELAIKVINSTEEDTFTDKETVRSEIEKGLVDEDEERKQDVTKLICVIMKDIKNEPLKNHVRKRRKNGLFSLKKVGKRK